MSATHFIEILFPEDLQPDDLEITAPATAEQPGHVRLGQARLGLSAPAAPNSRPLYSRSGAKIGFVAVASLIEPPYTHCYWLEDLE